MRTEWEPDELIGAWTLVEGDWKLIANKTGVLKFYEIEGRFPAYPEEVPRASDDEAEAACRPAIPRMSRRTRQEMSPIAGTT